MRKINTIEIKNAVYKLALDCAFNLTAECAAALNAAKESETGKENEKARFALDILSQNAEVANAIHLPVCQDTGLAVVSVEIGFNVRFTGLYITEAINQGVREAYRDGYLRKSACDPITRKNTADNTPAMITYDFIEGDNVKISFLAKGFGSENMSRIYMLNPSDGVEGIISAIVETVKLGGSNPCPPVIVGVGVGGTFDKCALLAKKALMRPITSFNARNDLCEIETVSLERINKLGIGAQGFGGKTTALKVNVEACPTHIAGLPVAVNIQCHCERKGAIIL